MKIATKYQVDSVTKAITHHIEQQWPRSLRDLLRMKGAIGALRRGPQVAGPSSLVQFPEPASAIRLATDFNIPSVLPGAYYVLATMNRESAFALGKAKWTLLDKLDLYRYYAGKSVLAQDFMLKAEAVYDVGFPEGCATVYDGDEVWEAFEEEEQFSSCRRVVAKMERETEQGSHSLFEAIRLAYSPDPVLKYMKMYDEVSEWGLCITCQGKARENIESDLEKLWQRLPEAFDL